MSFKSFFSQQARKPSGIFGRWIMSRIFNWGNAPLNGFMQEMLSLQKDDRVLEIGFGTGKLIYETASILNEGKIKGIDLSAEMTAMAIKRNKKFIDSGRVFLQQGDFESIHFKNGSFNKIYSVNTIYFWPDPNVWIKKSLDLLAPGGKLLIAFEDESQLKARPLDNNVFRIYDTNEIKHLLILNGFSEDVELVSRTIKDNIYHCVVALK